MSKFVTLHGFGGSGDSELNFEIVGGTTEPTNPKENTIWVNTDVEISSWAFDAQKPSNPTEGMVWIAVGTYSSAAFNILSKNTNRIYPLYTKQYINGVWTDKTAMSYQGGEWVDWFTYLYNKGDECTDVTGGWVAGTYREYSNVTAKAPTVSRGTDSIALSLSSSSASYSGDFYTAKKIKLDDYSKLVIHVNSWSGDGSCMFGAVTRTAAAFISDASYVKFGNSESYPNDFEVDVSTLTGEYYISLAMSAYNGYTSKVNFSEVYLK